MSDEHEFDTSPDEPPEARGGRATERVPSAARLSEMSVDTLLAAYEPVVRLTQGEMFLPVSVEGYVRHGTLWASDPNGTVRQVAATGTLDLASLAGFGTAVTESPLSLSGITVPDSWWQRFRQRRRAKRPKFHAGARLAQVGLLGRTIDTVSRFSLLLRGAVPGGSAALALTAQADHLHPERPTYHGRVVRDGDWIVCQYWYFYAFNNWRSGFSGVNEHEADWEQVTVFLDGTGVVDDDGLPPPRWVVFSAHDETGDDLRRRWDDPDLSVVDGRHPVVFAGAGSHSGAYLAGDYLVTVSPPQLGGLVPFVRWAARLFTPWSREAREAGLGIPYIDYARGDGPAVGPGEDLTWSRVVIDEDTAWVRDYRGLWGHDTRDRLGGERGPAGPRYERDGSVRASWGDPVGWAGLAKVAANPDRERSLVERRIGEIDRELERVVTDTAEARTWLATRAAGLDPGARTVRAMEAEEVRTVEARLTGVRLADERSRLRRTLDGDTPDVGPHAHLKHRRAPIPPEAKGRSWFLNAWAVVSTPLVLWLVSVILRPDLFDRWTLAVVLLVGVVAVEAFARGYFLAFLVRLVALVLIVFVGIMLLEYWQRVLSVTLALVAFLVLVVNIRDVRRP